ncbi:MAG: flagellar hook-basal body protein, partial [Halocynthiibacter sp.]
MKALYIAASGMAAQERNVEVISNNIANMRTTGYKRQRAEFQDMIYQTFRQAGSLTSDAGTQVPAGIEIGSGVKTASTSRIMSQGSVEPTEKELDLAISGEGFFSINLPDGRTGYTRDGSFERDSTGQMVTIDGYQVNPGIIIPGTARSVSISKDGIVQAYLENDSSPTQLGQ